MSTSVYNSWEFPVAKVAPPTERYLKLIASPETTSYEKATILSAHIPPGGATGSHSHPDSDEIMYCVGRGECTMKGENREIETDTVIVAPMGVEHECRNTSKTETLKLFCVFLPAVKLSETLMAVVPETREYLQEKA
ncbi:MAG: cupin domain-containing protein [Dehalococcoidales bacterium]|jgi:mannose-6-phosphate isomerase-like protein (cupin superfamily)|nr:cupin domain-containing protein [Dehalococcoidales bacterium]MDP7285981.1 cupin domain-containing protein [Dehalococcoidales bacterium]MDP7415882.1 cupin domain-containing protein [Dehalococcoidales bacterium]|tara:strand:+ start:19 stop:429 length:411 start_codon:yes stop_codon:yes gene_type:complete